MQSLGTKWTGTTQDAGCQVWPPSIVSSVKTSKKPAIMEPPSGPTVRALSLPSEASVGLSRNITPCGTFPPEIFSANISKS